MLRKFLPLLLAAVLHADSYTDALHALKKVPFGFCFFDAGITQQDLAHFDCLDINQERYFQQFGDLADVEERIADFLSYIGSNDPDLVSHLAKRLSFITNQVMAASGRETAWVHLRASIPTDAYDIPRWHIDGHYFRPDPEILMYRFALTLKGAPTIFYLLPNDQRDTAWKNMRFRDYMHQWCTGPVVSPSPGEAVYFIGGSKDKGALHTEPPIHLPRLFLSIVPCSEEQLTGLKAKIVAIYPKDKTHNPTASSP